MVAMMAAHLAAPMDRSMVDQSDKNLAAMMDRPTAVTMAGKSVVLTENSLVLEMAERMVGQWAGRMGREMVA